MNFSYENQGHSTFLTYEITVEDAIDTMTLGMITNNKISGIAQTIFTQLNNTKYLKYNVSAKIPVQQFFAGIVSKRHLLGVFKGIMSAIIEAEEYMIDANSLIFDLNYIYADVSTCETVMICLPFYETKEKEVDFNTFFKNIMFSTQFDQSENCDYIAKILNYLNSAAVFSIDDFYNLLKNIDGVAGQQAKPTQSEIVQPMQEAKNDTSVKPMVKPSTVEKSVEQPQIVQTTMQNTGVATTMAQNVQAATVTQQPVVPQPVAKQNDAFAIPGQGNANISVHVEETKKGKGMFSFLQGNKAKGKTSKESKKQAKPLTPTGKGFAIPGESVPTPQGFAIPGQPSPTPQSFAIPGQPSKPPVGSVKTGQSVMQPPVQPQSVEQPKPVQVQATPAPTPIQPIQTVPQGQAMNFGETTVLNAVTFGETTVLDAGMVQQEVKIQPHLIRAKNNERIELNKPVFRIGKEKSYVDYFISDNTAISRSHANVISRDGEYFVVDTNSTNHTYVNGMMIQSNVETKIADGAKIRLANEEFEFKLM